MLPAPLETDPKLLRPLLEIREVPAVSTLHKDLGDCLPYYTEWPADNRKNVTYYVMRSAYSKKLYDILLPINIKKFIKLYAAWVNGEHIQDVFGMLDTDIREFIKTGITPTEWKEMFPPEQDERDVK